MTALGGGILFYAMANRETLNGAETPPVLEPVSPETFTVRLKGRRGLMEYVHPYPGDDKAEKLLRQHETSRTFRPITSNGVVRFDNNWVASNDPIEDRHVEHYLSCNILSSTSAKGFNEIDLELMDQSDSSSLKLFSVIDGHAGYATADVLAKDLHPRVIKSLQSLYAGHEVDAVDPMLMMRQLQRADYRSFLRKYFELEGAPRRSSAQVNLAVPITSRGISDALTSAFVGLDYDICSGPLRLIANTKIDVSTKAGVKSISEPATNGACALTVMVDETWQEVYIANTGDSRAVAGYFVEPHTDSNGFHYHGGWRCEVLTEDHTANGPKELQRLQKDHPGEEDHLLSETGRVLGGLMPARAFGDSPYYKWTEEETEALEGNQRTGKLKFIILATDGLWEHLKSEEAVGLVKTHLTHPQHSPVERKKVQDDLLAQWKESADKYPGGRAKGEESKGNWIYQDKNAATHLIRNAFEACKWHPEAGKEVISAKPPIARWMRDDVTCSVIFFGDKDGEILFPPSKANASDKETSV
ncbi:hypothetical protein QFC24_006337 [Naganishia onofrii]|uniref:Uncharacterized protein n=1 Tax=Naganishia onofrii TaxID=1851511 RepID=A0ACC2X3V2_9TREE|nr:hypothetical protein QFC24_006337 [Naganishia onofrii]